MATQAYAGGPLVGHRLQTLREHMPADAEARIAAIYRQDKTIIPDGMTVIEENDTVFFLAAQRNIRTMMKELRPLDNPVRRIILAGGGNIGSNLARQLERKHHVKIIERDPTARSSLPRTWKKPLSWSAIVPMRSCCAKKPSTLPMSTAY